MITQIAGAEHGASTGYDEYSCNEQGQYKGDYGTKRETAKRSILFHRLLLLVQEGGVI